MFRVISENVCNLHENVVSTDYVEIAPEGYYFRGGVKYILHYFTYATEWSDKENIKRFRSEKALSTFYHKLGRGDVHDDYKLDCA